MKHPPLVVVVVIVLAAVGVMAGCAPPPRFADRGPLWRDPDDLPVPMPPVRPDPGSGRLAAGMDNAVFRPADRLFSVDYGLEAVNVNALDEVPDSSWYHDPRRAPADPGGPPRSLSPAEMERGAVVEEPPRAPFGIVKLLSGGSSPGFVIEDALGRRYALKFDPEGHAGLISGADVVTARLAWASGWLVPGNEIIELGRSDLWLRPGATRLDKWERAHPLSSLDVDALLWHVARAPDGRYRAVASRWIAGRILGSFSWLGRNRADANDRYRHENRRDLRGFGVWAAWVDDVDVIENNTLDSYVGEPGRGHVRHYQIDVGGSLGVFSARPAQYWMGEETYFQFGRILGSLLTVGAMPRRWVDPRWQRARSGLVEQYPEFGGFSAVHFDPRAWRPIVDIPPFVRQTVRDRYWGAKRITAFDADELRAAVAAAHYRPEAASYLFQTLWARRNRIARDYFSATSPLDYFRIDGGQLCFSDLWVRAGLGDGGATNYRATEGGHVVDLVHRSDGAGRACVVLPSREGYRIVELSSLRPGDRRFGPSVQVHLMAQHGDARLLGVLR